MPFPAKQPATSQSDAPWHYPAPWSGVSWLPARPSAVRRAIRTSVQTLTSGLLVVGGALAAATLINVVLSAIVGVAA